MHKGSRSRGERSHQGGLSLREFARRIGVSDTAVRKAIKAGRLSKSLGKSATGHPFVLDFSVAQAEWRRSTRTGTGVRTDGLQPGAGPPPAPPDAGAAPEPAPADLDLQGMLHPADEISASSLIEAQRLATLERARKLRYENDISAGRLVSTEAAAKEAFEAARIIRESILNLPARLAGELAAETDPARVHMRLEAALREALNATADQLAAAVNG